jgi:hypothetical protein
MRLAQECLFELPIGASKSPFDISALAINSRADTDAGCAFRYCSAIDCAPWASPLYSARVVSARSAAPPADIRPPRAPHKKSAGRVQGDGADRKSERRQT